MLLQDRTCSLSKRQENTMSKNLWQTITMSPSRIKCCEKGQMCHLALWECCKCMLMSPKVQGSKLATSKCKSHIYIPVFVLSPLNWAYQPFCRAPTAKHYHDHSGLKGVQHCRPPSSAAEDWPLQNMQTNATGQSVPDYQGRLVIPKRCPIGFDPLSYCDLINSYDK